MLMMNFTVVNGEASAEPVAVSTGCTATLVNNSTGTTKDASTLFDGTGNLVGNGGANWAIAWGNTGYIQVDLKKAYSLCEIVIHRANQGRIDKAIPIQASNDESFSTFDLIGTTDGTHTKVSDTDYWTSAVLDSTNKYRYVRIIKNSGYDFYPAKIDVFGIKEPLAIADMTCISIGTDTDINITFNDFLDPAIDMSTITVTQNGKNVEIEKSISDDFITISPADAWKAGGIYKITIPAGVVEALDGRVIETEIEKYFGVNTDVIDFREFNVNGNVLDINFWNVSENPIDITLWNVAFAEGNSVDAITEDIETVPSSGSYTKTLTLSENYAVYLFEDVANMKTFVSPFVRNNGASEKEEYNQVEETLTAEYTDAGISVNGKSNSDEVSVFVTNGEAISATSVKAITLAAPSNGGYALNIVLPDSFPSGEYNVWASDGTLATPDKAVNAPYVLSSTDKQNYAEQIAAMDSAALKEFFEYDSTDELDTDNTAVLNGIGIISERPSDVQSLYNAVANLTLTGTYQEIVADINEQLALAITKEKGVAYGADNYNAILGIDTTNELYKYAEENSLLDEVSTLMSKDYTDATSFNANLLDGAKLAIFANAPSIAYATSFASTHSSFFNFDFSGDYTNLTDLQQQQVVQAAMSGTTADGMRTIFNNKVAELKNLNANNNNNYYGGGGGGGGGGASRPSTSTNAGIPLPEIKVEEEKPTPTQEGFSDMNESHWAYGTVMSLVEKGIVNGTDGKFMPEDNVTREQFVKMLVLAAKSEEKGEVSFADVPSDAWYYEYVSAAKNNGIVNGVSQTHFGTGLNITRQDMAVMIYNTMKSVGKSFEKTASSKFDDTEEIKDYAIEAVKQLSAAGIINGRDNNMFVPSGNATRAEAATIISRMLDLIA